jgi:hypothetical protein
MGFSKKPELWRYVTSYQAVATADNIATLRKITHGHVTQMRTLDTPFSVSLADQAERTRTITSQTRAKYCRPVREVEREIAERLGETIDDKAAADAQTQPPTSRAATAPLAENGRNGAKQPAKPVEPDYEEI